MKLKDLVAELQRSCDDGYGDYEVMYDSIVTSIATGFKYQLKAKIGSIYYCKSSSTVGLCSVHFLELDDEKNRIYEKMVHAQSECDRCEEEITGLQTQIDQTKEHIKSLKSKQKPWWRF